MPTTGAGKAGAALPDVALFGRDPRSLDPRSRRNTPVTDWLITSNLTVFAFQLLTRGAIVDKLAKVNSAIAAGQWWRFMTPAFCHAGIVHLLVNMYSLHNVGRGVEVAFGRERYLQVYAAGAIAGNVASYFGSVAPAVGASGAIFGLVGAQMCYLKRNERLLGKRRVDAMIQSMSFMVLINALLGLTSPQIDNWGHAGGFVGGATAAWLLGPKFEGHRGILVDNPPVNVLYDAWQRAISAR
eukprot:PRCOL_00004536-RA